MPHISSKHWEVTFCRTTDEIQRGDTKEKEKENPQKKEKGRKRNVKKQQGCFHGWCPDGNVEQYSVTEISGPARAAKPLTAKA